MPHSMPAKSKYPPAQPGDTYFTKNITPHTTTANSTGSPHSSFWARDSRARHAMISATSDATNVVAASPSVHTIMAMPSPIDAKPSSRALMKSHRLFTESAGLRGG